MFDIDRFRRFSYLVYTDPNLENLSSSLYIYYYKLQQEFLEKNIKLQFVVLADGNIVCDDVRYLTDSTLKVGEYNNGVVDFEGLYAGVEGISLESRVEYNIYLNESLIESGDKKPGNYIYDIKLHEE